MDARSATLAGSPVKQIHFIVGDDEPHIQFRFSVMIFGLFAVF